MVQFDLFWFGSVQFGSCSVSVRFGSVWIELGFLLVGSGLVRFGMGWLVVLVNCSVMQMVGWWWFVGWLVDWVGWVALVDWSLVNC